MEYLNEIRKSKKLLAGKDKSIMMAIIKIDVKTAEPNKGNAIVIEIYVKYKMPFSV